MKCIIDAQLPRRLIHRFRDAGFDAIHTLDLPKANETEDTEIIIVAQRESRIVVTKDSDFVDSLLLSGQPEKLLLVSTGNIKNADLEHIFVSNLSKVQQAFADNQFVELTRHHIIIHF